ncbi:hypothetical protein PAPHI01_0129 [Pancytospora philotis]|nr:hypothetical protein PAPHI01_0129 [Pancytospora philotis]
MDIADLLVEEITAAQKSTGEREAYEQLRPAINAKAAIKKTQFNELVELLERDTVAVLSAPNPTHKETDIISKAIRRAKLADQSGLFAYLRSEDSKRSPVLIHAVVAKGGRLDTDQIVEYLHDIVANKKIFLCHLKILLAVSRFYPAAITPTVINFCKQSTHDISKELLRRHKVQAE